MPNNVYNNPLWLAGELRTLGIFSTDCVASLLGAADGDVVEGVRISINGSATASNGDATVRNFGVWDLESAVAADTFSLRIGDPNEVLAVATENEIYAEWFGRVSDSAGAATQVIFGFGGGPVSYLASWDGTTGQWVLASNNGSDPIQTSVLQPGVGPAGVYHRWQITLSANAVVYRLNGETVAVHNLTVINVPAVLVTGQTVDGTVLTVSTDQLLVYQAGLNRD